MYVITDKNGVVIDIVVNKDDLPVKQAAAAEQNG